MRMNLLCIAHAARIEKRAGQNVDFTFGAKIHKTPLMHVAKYH
jgi:hypothetical protein